MDNKLDILVEKIIKWHEDEAIEVEYLTELAELFEVTDRLTREVQVEGTISFTAKVELSVFDELDEGEFDLPYSFLARYNGERVELMDPSIDNITERERY